MEYCIVGGGWAWKKSWESNLRRVLQLFLTPAKFLFFVYCCDQNVGNTAHCPAV